MRSVWLALGGSFLRSRSLGAFSFAMYSVVTGRCWLMISFTFCSICSICWGVGCMESV